MILASVLLMSRLLTHDFRLSYVASYSGRDLPFYYLFSTFWAGQEGSFLLWLFWGSIIGLFVLRSAKEQESPVMIVYVASFIGIVAILVKQSPFRFLGQIPPDGQGLNPLLQDPWMVIHPPVMFSGFASLSVPFAFAIAALWSKRWDGWVVRAMPWALFTFVTLGTAILMGGYWAYKTLGWGGYWAWDPVENTSLVPWLATVALVHGMFLQKAREKHRKINIILAILAFCCILYGTFLTRSGVLADFSVHSFIDLGITGWLVGIIVVFLVGGPRPPRVPLEGDPGRLRPRRRDRQGKGRAVPLALRPLHPLRDALLRVGPRDPPRDLGSDPHADLRQGLAGLDGLLQRDARADRGAHRTPPRARPVPVVARRNGEGRREEGLRRVRRRAPVGGRLASRPASRGPRDLAILSFAVFGIVANAQTVVLFVRRKAIKPMGGYLAHVGISIMLVGILISGVYEKKTTGEPVRRASRRQVGRHTMTFTRVIFVTEKGDVKPFRGAEHGEPRRPPRQAGDGGRRVVARTGRSGRPTRRCT